MSHITTKFLFLLIISLLFSPFALAQTAAEVEASAAIDASITPPPLPMRPLDVLKARAKEIKQNTMNAKIDLRQDTKIQLQNAGTGERKDILKNAVGARIDIAKDRKASSTDLRGDVKALVRWHGGLIKERFVLAIRHFNKILTRIDTRLGKMEADGIDTSAAAQIKVDAEIAVDKAEADAQAVATFVANVPQGSGRAAIRAELQAKIRTAQQSIKAAHEAVQKAVRALVDLAKNSRPKANVDVSATSSSSVE